MAGPTSSPARSTEGSSRYSTLAFFLPHSSAATPQMGKESPSDPGELCFGLPLQAAGQGNEATWAERLMGS